MPSRRAMLAALGAAGTAGAVGAARVAGVRRPVEVTGEWYRGSYDSGRTGYSREREGPGPGLTRRWSTRIPDGIHSPAPVLVDGGVHVVAASGVSRQDDAGAPVRLLRVDPASGRLERETVVTRYDGPHTVGALVWDSLVYADGTFYVLAFDGVHALAPDGSERWHRSFGGAPSNSILATGHPVVAGEMVYVPTASTTDHTEATEGLYALDSRSGDVRWRYEVPEGRGWTFAPAAADGTVYCSAIDYGVVALDAATGAVEWETRLPVNGPPTVAAGHVYVSAEVTTGDPAHVVALAAGTGEEAWRSTDDGTWLGRSVAAAEDRVFHREALSDLVCRDAATGEVRWRQELAVAGLGTPALVDGRVYSLARPAEGGDTGLLALDAATGERVGFASTRYGSGGDASVAVSDGLAFATTSTGTLEAFETCVAGVDGHCLH
jgi:outer membrane protein assembly factor BamB